MPFEFTRDTILPDVAIVAPRVFSDERGWFMEAFKQSEFAAAGLPPTFVQDNHSASQRGVVRGLHYQLPPSPQGKLVRCLRGEVFDVAVDVRSGSPTFARWTGHVLSDANRRMLYVPPGFAHGFCALSELAEVHYKTTAEWAPGLERAIRFDDPALAIAWPLRELRASPKDASSPPLAAAELPASWE